MENNKTVVEINGIKMEVDLRYAKKIDHYSVGDSIKILIKDGYLDEFNSYIGTIIGFDEFEKTPTIVIAYLKTSYGEAEIQYCYYNSKTKDVEICPLNDWDIPVTKQQVIDRFNKEIQRAEQSIHETTQKKKLFEQFFGKYFEKIEVGISR